jgi:hypothetical protein
MNQDYLHQTARQLRQPPAEAAREFAVHHETLAGELNLRMSARPDLDRLIGPGNLAMMEDNSRNFCRFMSVQFLAYEPAVLVHTALWVFRAYRAHGFQTTYWPANLDTFIEIARARLTPETFAQVYPFLEWLVVHIPVFVQLTNEPSAAAPTAPDGPSLAGPHPG